jgi:hypothetical protein
LGCSVSLHFGSSPVACAFIRLLFFRLIGKLTAFLQLQEVSLRNPPVDFSTSVARFSMRKPHDSYRKLTAFLQLQEFRLFNLTAFLTAFLQFQEFR